MRLQLQDFVRSTGVTKKRLTFAMLFLTLLFVSFDLTLRTEGRGALKDWAGTLMRRPSIGVVLPLSGDYASFGESTLKGVFLASGIFGPLSEELLPIDVIVKDSKGDSITTADAVEELVREGVIAIIGPLLSRTSVAGALKAQELKIPIISLSQKEGLPELGDYIFRNSLTSSMQARALTEFAMLDLGLDTFAILYPQNTYGERLRKSFVEEVEKLGGKIVRSESYNDEQTDFGAEIKSIFQIKVVKDTKKKGRVTYEPIIDFDALFIPDYSERIRLIAPQLAYYNIKDLQLLGSNGWNSPQLLKVEDPFLEGAVFTDGFFIDSPDPTVRGFKKDFEETFKILPGILEAQAFDATKIIIYILKERGVIDRVTLKEYLKDIKDFSGVTGRITFDQIGEALKDLFLLRTENGKIFQIEIDKELYQPLKEEDLLKVLEDGEDGY